MPATDGVCFAARPPWEDVLRARRSTHARLAVGLLAIGLAAGGTLTRAEQAAAVSSHGAPSGWRGVISEDNDDTFDGGNIQITGGRHFRIALFGADRPAVVTAFSDQVTVSTSVVPGVLSCVDTIAVTYGESVLAADFHVTHGSVDISPTDSGLYSGAADVVFDRTVHRVIVGTAFAPEYEQLVQTVCPGFESLQTESQEQLISICGSAAPGWSILSTVDFSVSQCNPSTAQWTLGLCFTEKVSTDSSGAELPQTSSGPQVMSRDGHSVAFISNGLLTPPTSTASQAYVRDLRGAAPIERVSLGPSGYVPTSGVWAGALCLSGDARFVGFASSDTGLDPADPDSDIDLFLRDRFLGTTRLVSTSGVAGASQAGFSGCAISDDGRFVAFDASAPIVAADTNGATDVYERDMTAALPELASVDTSGQLGFGASGAFPFDMSADGTLVAFESIAILDSASDTNSASDVYLRDRTAGTTTLVSRTPAGAVGDRASGVAGISMSPDGRWLAFTSRATNMPPLDPERLSDIFLLDRQSGTLELVTVDQGPGPHDYYTDPSVSDDGAYIAFTGNGLALEDTTVDLDIYVRDRAAGLTRYESVDNANEPGNGQSERASVDGSGLTFAFRSYASNLEGPFGTDANGTNTDIFVRSCVAFPVKTPSPPSSVTAAAGDTEASVSWAASASNGGSPLTGYRVTSSPDAITAIAEPGSTSTTVRGLANDTTYTFTVAAQNVVGAGAASLPSVAVTPRSGAQGTSSVIPPGEPGGATTDPGGGPTPSDPLTTTVGIPAGTGGGSLSITERPASGTPPAGYQVFGQQVDIISTAATTDSNPLTIVFTIDGSAIEASLGLTSLPPDPSNPPLLDIIRAESGNPPDVIAACTTLNPLAKNPCVLDRQYVNGGSDLQVTILTSRASHWTTVVSPTNVTLTDTRSNPALVTVPIGHPVLWTFTGTKPHTVTDLLKLGPGKTSLYNSGSVVTGRFGFVFLAAGTYVYGSTIKGDPLALSGIVAARLSITPSAGSTADTFAVTWATSAITGYAFDVQYRFKKTGSRSWSGWKSWKSGVSIPNTGFVPGLGAGSYSFVARLRNKGSGYASGWSPETMIIVH